MKAIHKVIFLFCIGMMLTSCVVTKKQKDRFCKQCPSIIEKHDSVVIKETLKDTTIYITQTGPTVFVPSPCDSAGNLKPIDIRKKKNGIVISIKSNGKNIEANCDTDSLEQVISGLTKEIERTKSHVEVRHIKDACEREHRNGFDYFTRWWFWISVGLLLLYILWRKYIRFHIPK